MAKNPGTFVQVDMAVDEHKDRVRLMFSKEISFFLLHPQDGIKMGEAMVAVSKKILTTPPEGVKLN